MYSLQVNRTSPDKVYTTIRNVDGDSITAGLCARYLGGAVAGSASIDGVSAVKMPASDNSQWINFAGVAITDIASDEYGIVQSWGYSENVSLSAETNLTIGIYGGPAGTILRSSPVAGQLTSKGSALHALSAHFYRYVQVWNTSNVSGGIPQGKCWIRAF